jgi:4-amino-4-deoxy-L-arabinose transferase-like glycosyltransferase
MNLKKVCAACIVLSIITKLLFLIASGVWASPQTFECEQAAVNMLKGNGFYYTNFQSKYYSGIAPGYPALCYLVYRIFGHHQLLIIAIQIITTSVLVIPVSYIARRIFGDRTAMLTAFLVALFPPFVIYATSKLHTLNIYALFFALLVIALMRLKESITPTRVISTGAFAGLSALFRFTSVVFTASALVWLYLAAKEERKKKAWAILSILAIIIIMLSPLSIRNYILFKKPFLIQTNKGESLWLGNMPDSGGSLFTDGMVPLQEKGESQLSPEFYSMNEIEKGEYLARLTAGYFRNDPVRFIGRIFKKMYYFWFFSPYQGGLYPAPWARAYKAYYLLMFCLAVFAVFYNLFASKKWNGTDALLVALFFLSLMAAHSLYYVEARHRWAVEPLMLAFSANGIVALISIAYETIWNKRETA